MQYGALGLDHLNGRDFDHQYLETGGPRCRVRSRQQRRLRDNLRPCCVARRDVPCAPRYAVEEAEKVPEVGVVTGLAWTANGGDILLIEALRMTGTGRLTVTGQLGDVMRESVDAAYSYVRSRAKALSIEDSVFRESDLHVHLPAGVPGHLRDRRGGHLGLRAAGPRGVAGTAGDRPRV